MDWNLRFNERVLFGIFSLLSLEIRTTINVLLLMVQVLMMVLSIKSFSSIRLDSDQLPLIERAVLVCHVDRPQLHVGQ